MKSTSIRRRRNSGFTLIEILVVVLIIGFLVGTVGVNAYNMLFKGQRGTAENQIELFHQALDLYKLEYQRYPEDLEQLTEDGPGGEPWMKRLPLDPWNNEYEYELTSDNQPLITCFGEDGEPGGDGKNEDISSATLGLVDA